MGRPKQLLPWKNKTLIENAIQTALEVDKAKVYVVLGANHLQIERIIKPYPIAVLINKKWQKGLGNSIAFGVNNIFDKAYKGVLIMLADQPLIDSHDLIKLITEFNQGYKSIIATKYKGEKVGVPVIFDKFYFHELTQLNGDNGAKSLFKKYFQNLIPVELSNDVIDIDTKDDYIKLKND